jgi:TolB-like protein
MNFKKSVTVILKETKWREESQSFLKGCFTVVQHDKPNIPSKRLIQVINLFITFLFLSQPLFSQVNVAVSNFSNESDVLFLDAWERSVPTLLRSHLSGNKDIVVLDRDRLDKVLEEQALTLTGLIDSSDVQSIGKILGADFILSGKIDKQNNDFVISADLVRVKTGQIQTEIVRSANQDYKEAMVEMLASNLLYRLSGQGEYQTQKVFKSNSIWYWTGTTLLLGGATLATNSYHEENLDKYKDAGKLKDFDKFYDRANDSKKVFNVLGILAGSAAIGTLVDLLSGSEENEIRSGHSMQSSIKSTIYLTGNDDIQIGLQIHF